MINLTHLKFFFDSSRLGSVSEAAHHNFVSQSAISQGIKKLEIALGMQLSHHLRQSFQLTSEGRILFEECQQVFQVLDNMMDRIHSHRGVVKGIARLVCPNSIAHHLLPKVLKTFWAEYPEVKVDFHRGSRAFIRNSLKDGSADFALVLNSEEFTRYEKRILGKGRFGLYKSSKYNESPEDGIWVDSEMNAEFLQKKQLPIRGELSSWTMVASFIGKGMGIGLIPDFMAEKNWKLLKCPKKEYELWGIWPKGHQLLTPSAAFLDTVESLFN